MRYLSRKRLLLVRHKTAHILSLKSLIDRCCAKKMTTNDIKRNLTHLDLKQLLNEDHWVLSAQTNLNSIRFLIDQITRLERSIKKKVRLDKSFKQLLTVPGIGEILAMTIMLEVGDIGRFPKVGIRSCKSVFRVSSRQFQGEHHQSL